MCLPPIRSSHGLTFRSIVVSHWDAGQLWAPIRWVQHHPPHWLLFPPLVRLAMLPPVSRLYHVLYLNQVRRTRRLGYGLGLASLMSGCANHELLLPAPRPTVVMPGLSELHRAILKAPTDPAPHTALARLYVQLSQPLLGAEEARTAVALAPSFADAHAALGESLLRLNSHDPAARTQEIDEARDELERALELEPDRGDYLVLAIDIALAGWRTQDAAGYLERLEKGLKKEKAAQNPAYLERLGRLQLQQHNYSAAQKTLEACVKHLPQNDYHVVPLQAWALFMLGEDDEALSTYQSIPESYLDRDDRLVLATLALRRPDLTEAQVQLKARTSTADDDGELLEQLEMLDQVQQNTLKLSALADLFEGRLALQAHDLDRAEARLRRGLETDRRLPDAPEALAEILLNERKDPRQAAKVLGDAPTDSATHHRYHLAVQAYRQLQDAIGAQEVLREYVELVALDVESGRRKEARASLETMVLLLPVPSLWQFLLDLAVEDNDPDGLLAAWDKLKGVVTRPDVSFVVSTGEALITLGWLEPAEKMMRQALLREPTNAGLLFGLAQIADKQDNTALAEEAYRRLTVIHPGAADSWIAMGQFYVRTREWDEARGAFEEALRREQDPPDALYGLAQALLGLRRRDDALATARRLTTVAPNAPRSWFMLAKVAGDARRYEEQELALRQGIMRDQNNLEGWKLLARFLLDAPDPSFRHYDEAAAAATRAVELSQRQDPGALGLQAEALMEVGRTSEALSAIEQALLRNPESDEFHRQRRRIRTALESATSNAGGALPER